MRNKAQAGRQRPEATTELKRSFIGAQVASLLSRMPWATATLTASSFASGLVETGILAILAEAALLLAKHQAHLDLHVGPLRTSASAAGMLTVGAGLALLRLGLGVVNTYIPAHISTAANVAFRKSLFEAFTHASWGVQSRDREGHFQDLITNQVNGATQAYLFAAQLITSLLTFLVLVVSALALSPLTAIAILVVAIMLSVVLRPLANLGERRAQAVSQGWLRYAGGVTETVRLAEEAHVFGAGDELRRRQDQLIDGFRSPSLQLVWLGSLVGTVYQSLLYLLLLGSLLLLHAIAPHNLGTLGVVVLLLVRSGSYGQQIQAAIQGLRQSQPYVERLHAAENAYRKTAAPPRDTQLEAISSLELRRVSFSYDGLTPTLSNVDLAIRGGETVGVVGPSGAGKSTLVQILLGLREPTSGEYLVNRRDSADYTRESWRTSFAFVPQDPRLLHASVVDNIRFFRDIPAEAVERAAVQAGIHDDIMSWHAGYQTIIGPRADAVSGGQQQRICLARALAGEPSVLILDEPTSALDPLAEQVIQDSLSRLNPGLTLIIVAHRMSTLQLCERVLVVVEGKIEAFASVDTLLAGDGYYRSAVAASVAPARGVADLSPPR